MAKLRDLKADNKRDENGLKSGKNATKTRSKSEEIAKVSIVQRLTALVVVILAYIYGRDFILDKLFSDDIDVFASVTETISQRSLYVKCSNDYGTQFKACLPNKCGRFVMDNIVSKQDAIALRKIAEKGMSYGGGDGGATILDLHTGALSYGQKFINIYKIPDKNDAAIFTEQDFSLYKRVKDRIHKTIAETFEIDPHKLYLTKPTFFSRLTNKAALTLHDEYWHSHVDKVTYGSFYYTSLLYLSNAGEDFQGGKFCFVAQTGNNSTVDPKLGRVSFFTSGSENEHFVQRVTGGTRYAITVSFTCDRTFAISDPSGVTL